MYDWYKGSLDSHRGNEEATDETAHDGSDQANAVREPVVRAPEGVVGAVELVDLVFVAGDKPSLRLNNRVWQ